MTLADAINEACDRYGSLRKAAKALGFSPSYASRLRSGVKISPGPRVLAKLGVEPALSPAEVQYRKRPERLGNNFTTSS